MANAEYKPPVAPVIAMAAPITNGELLEGVPSSLLKDIKRLVVQNDELFGQNKSMKKQMKELETAVRSMSRELKSAGLNVKVLPKLDGGESE